jgi:NADPH:quinone reductase-like Zn-dependent oxidoreductase
MNAIVRDRYGGPEVLRIGDKVKPTLTPDGVLVRVHAAGVNAHDWHMMRGKPYLARPSEGFRRPKDGVLGIELAGIAEAVGANVTDIQPGDAVFGSRWGAFAEYVVGRNIVPMPSNLTFEEAATIPVTGQTALQGLRDKGGLEPGQRVLINGAGGGVGTSAIQIAKALGGVVTAVTRTASVDLARSLGADEVIDHTREDYTRSGRRWDLVLDVGGNHSLAATARALTPTGTMVLVAPGPGDWAGPIIRVVGAAVRSRLTKQRFRPFLSQVSREDLLFLKELVETGKLRPVVDRTYAFEQVPEAITYVESGRARGKIAITVGELGQAAMRARHPFLAAVRSSS